MGIACGLHNFRTAYRKGEILNERNKFSGPIAGLPKVEYRCSIIFRKGVGPSILFCGFCLGGYRVLGGGEMNNQAGELVRCLQVELKRNYHSWNVTNLEFAGAGVEFVVCRADSTEFGPIAIKVPWNRWISTNNDGLLDTRDLLQQEATLSSHLRLYGVATPEVYALHVGDSGFDFLVSKFVEHDQSYPNMYELGQLVRTIHDSRIPDTPLVMQGKLPFDEMLADRLVRRLKIVEKLSRVQLNPPEVDCVCVMLKSTDSTNRILHMDVRPENVLTQNSSVIAIVDWTNALIGNAALELARIAEYGHLDSEFLVGYGDPDVLSRLPRRVEILYRLDTAVMLAVVFFSGQANPNRAKTQIQRVVKLYEALRKDT